MPYVNDILAEQQALAEAPTLGNLHPDARAQAIARAGRADADQMRRRLEWLHSPASHRDADGYEWGIFRVKWENGKAVEVWQTNSDFSDLDAAMAARGVAAFDEAQQLAMRNGHEMKDKPSGVPGTYKDVTGGPR